MEYQLIEKMKVHELKSFLRLRGLRVSGNKSELVARVFVASENGVKIVKTAEEVEYELKEDYGFKLLIENDLVIPDPLKDASDNWLAEEKGIAHWPKISYGNIFNYLKFCTSDLGSDDLSDYKTSKGYSYYNRGWMGVVSIRLFGEKYCVLRGDCRASERINDPFHKLWVCPLKPLELSDIATALEDIAPLSTLMLAVPRPKIDFIREVITRHPLINVISVDDVVLMSTGVASFFKNLDQITPDIITKLEVLTRGQSNNEAWYECRKGVFTASKAHDILTRMRKFKHDNTLNLWNLFQIISGMVFVNPNIPALKYGRDMESFALEKFVDLMKIKYQGLCFAL